MSDNSTPRHTPGPWFYRGGVVDAPINGTSPSTTICERISARDRGYGPLAERQAIADADGRLIAAAPELLAALRNLVAWEDMGGFRGPCANPDAAPFEAARDALAKVSA